MERAHHEDEAPSGGGTGAPSNPDLASEVIEVLEKLFRVADLALVVYRGRQIIGVKHSEVGPWLVWDLKLVRWERALPKDARAFERLPLAGHVEN